MESLVAMPLKNELEVKKSTYLFVLPWSLRFIGGVNQVVKNLAKNMLMSQDFDPLILIMDWNARKPIWEDVNGLKTVRWRIRPFHTDMSFKEKVAYRLWEFRVRPMFEKFCREHRIVAINPHYPGASAFTIERLIKASKLELSLILSFHGTDVAALTGSSANTIEQWSRLLVMNRVVTCSRDLSSRITKIFGDDVKPQVIYNGLDVAAFLATATSTEKIGSRTILNVGKFDANKGQDILIEAFAEVAHDYHDVNLIFVGGSGAALEKLRKLCILRNIENRVQFFVDVPHAKISSFFEQATLFVFPSRMESFGLVLLEAGAYELPVIASRVGGISELITDGKSGKLFQVEDVKALSNCIRALLDSPEAASEMGKNLKRLVTTDFTWASAGAQYANLINTK